MKFNLNNTARIKVLPPGEKLWEKYHTELGVPVPPIDRDSKGYTKLQMWTVMNIFGPGMTMGFNPPIETDITVESH